MKTKQNEFVIGLSVTIATLIVIFTILWLGKSNFLVKGLHLNMLVDNAQGISVGDEILYRGLAVGSVQDAEILEKGINVHLKIEKAPHLSKDSHFVIKSVNLLGEMAVEIIPGTSAQTLVFGDTVYGETDKGLSAITEQGSKIEKQVDSVLTNIKSLSGPQTLINMNKLLHSWQQTAQDLNTLINGDLKESLANIKVISEENKKPLHTVLDSLSQNAGALAAAIRNFKSASAQLDTLLKSVNMGKGSLGKLAKSDSLYYNLNRSVEHLDSLLIDIKKNPKRYVEIKVL